MKKVISIFIGLIICFSCEKKLTYQPPKEDLTTLIELALNSCDINKKRKFLEGKNTFYINFYNSRNILNRPIKYLEKTVDSNFINYKHQENECLIFVGKYKKISTTKFYVLYWFDGSNVENESLIEYKNNQWVSGDCVNSIY